MSLGLGSVAATLASNAPWLVWFSTHKALIFSLTAVMLAGNFWFVLYLPARRACPPGQPCHIGSTASKWTRRLFWLSVGMYGAALFLVYGLVPVLRLFEGAA